MPTCIRLQSSPDARAQTNDSHLLLEQRPGLSIRTPCSSCRGQLPPHHLQMRLVILASVRVGGNQRAVLELHGRSEAAPLEARTRLRIQEDAVPGKIERKA